MESRLTKVGHFRRAEGNKLHSRTLTSTTLRELDQSAKKKARTELPLPDPGPQSTWIDPLWEEVKSCDAPMAEADSQQRQLGLQTYFNKLLQIQPIRGGFELHDAHDSPSVCGSQLKPDYVMTLRNQPRAPITTGLILGLITQKAVHETDQNIGKVILYGKPCLQQLPESLCSKLMVAITDLGLITLITVSFADGTLDVQMVTLK